MSDRRWSLRLVTLSTRLFATDYTRLKCGLTLLTAEHALVGGVALIRCIILFIRANNQRTLLRFLLERAALPTC